MKKIIVCLILALMVAPAFSQDLLEGAMLTQYKKDKEKSDEKIRDAKANMKAATWMERAKLFENIALLRDTTEVIDDDAANKALEAYKKVVELDKTKKGDPGKLAKEAQVVLDGEKQTPLYDAFINQGVKYFMSKKNMQGALESFALAHSVFKTDTTGALYAAISAQQLGNFDEAVKNYGGYAQNGGKDASAYYGYAQLYKEKNDYDKALSVLDLGLKVNENHKDLMSEKVNILLVAGREDEAIRELSLLTEKDPNVVNLTNLGILYDNRYSKYTKDLREVEDKLAQSGVQKDRLQDELEQEKSKIEIYDGEIKRLTARLKAQPRSADLKRQLDEVKKSKEETEASIAKIGNDIKAAEEKANSVDKSALETQLNDLRAKQTEAKNNALTTYEKAIGVDGNNYDALFGLGAIYYNEGVELKREVDNMNMQEYQAKGKEVESKVCGRFKKSRPYFERAAAVNPDSDAKVTLDNINNIIQQVESKNIPCSE